MDQQDSQKLKIKIGNAEFEAEGPTELLREQFERFMNAVERMGERQPATLVPKATSGGGTVTSCGVPMPGDSDDPSSGTAQTAPIADEMISRTFRRDPDSVSLLALPRSDDGGADALVLLLYGYQRLMGRGAVNGYTLIRAARQSGVNVPRVDVVMAKRGDYVLAAGSKRGKVYSLNNRGVAYAETVLRRTLE